MDNTNVFFSLARNTATSVTYFTIFAAMVVFLFYTPVYQLMNMI